MTWNTVEPYQWRQEVSDYDYSFEPPRPLYRVVIAGQKGTVQADDIVWIVNRFDYIDELYWNIQAVLDGHYHCCLSGKCWNLP